MVAAGQPSLGLFSAEGGQFIGGHGMNEDNKLKTAAGLSCAWASQFGVFAPATAQASFRADASRRT
jgi:hypothetical protein